MTSLNAVYAYNIYIRGMWHIWVYGLMKLHTVKSRSDLAVERSSTQCLKRALNLEVDRCILTLLRLLNAKPSSDNIDVQILSKRFYQLV